MPQIKIKTSHVRRLKELGVYDQWVANTKASMIVDDTSSKTFTGMDTLRSVISSSFVWADTPEGHVFWSEIF